jgi:DNA-binding IclR family transcriptional regulator
MKRSPNSASGANDDHTVPMVAKVLKIFELFEKRGSFVTMTEVIEECDISKSSAFRILETLRKAGYLTKTEHGPYRLTYKLLGVAMVVQEKNLVRKVAFPYLEALQRKSLETANLGVLEGDHVTYVEVLESDHQLRMVPKLGSKGPLHATALGKVMLANLPEDQASGIVERLDKRRYTPNTIVSGKQLQKEFEQIVKQGYAIDNEEDSQGCTCVAAAILDAKQRVAGAISISAPTSRMKGNRVDQLGKLVRETAQRISRQLGHK